MKKRNLQVILALTGVALVTRLVLVIFINRYFVDDAYIFMRYAENFATSHGLVYNVGERVLGFTSFLYGVGIPITKWFLPFVPTSTLITIVNLLLFVCYTYFVYCFLEPASPLFWPTLVFLLFSYPAIESSVNGMETILFIAMILGTLWKASEGEFGQAMVFASLGFLTRPEGSFLLAAVLFVAVFRLRGIRKLVGGITASLILMTAVLLAIYGKFGTLIPQSMMAKSSQFTEIGGGYHVGIFTRGLLLAFGISDTSYFRLPETVKWFVLAAFALSLAVFAYGMLLSWKERIGVFIGGLFFLGATGFYEVGNPVRMFSWYTYPTSICYIVVVLFGLERIQIVKRVALLRNALAVALVVVCVAEAALVGYKRGQEVEENVADLQNLALKIQKEYPQAQTIMLSDIGIFGHTTKAKIIDLAGLVTPLVFSRGMDGVRYSLGEIIEQSQPDVICLTHDPLQGKEIVEGHVQYVTFRSGQSRAIFLEAYRPITTQSKVYPHVFVHKRIGL